MDIGDMAITGAVLIVLYAILKPLQDRAKSGALVKKFQSLGNMTGKSLAEITAVVGSPTLSEYFDDGAAHEWGSTNYAIKLEFDKNNICIAKLGEVSKS